MAVYDTEHCRLMFLSPKMADRDSVCVCVCVVAEDCFLLLPGKAGYDTHDHIPDAQSDEGWVPHLLWREYK